MCVCCGCVFGMKTRTGQAFRHFEFPVRGQRDNQCPLPNALRYTGLACIRCQSFSWVWCIESPLLLTWKRGGAVLWVMVMVTDVDSVSIKGSNLLAWGRYVVPCRCFFFSSCFPLGDKRGFHLVACCGMAVFTQGWKQSRCH